jgi:type IV pilus assembly protein PilV
MKTNLRRQAGFSIVEVMVAMVVLAVGMLGMASLYVTTLRSSGSAMSRLQAVNLASDLADRIRANRFGKAAYAGTAEQKDCMGITKTCTQEDMAKNDLYLWQAQIDALLPGGATNAEGKVVYTAGATVNDPDNYTITVLWKEPGTSADEGDADLRLSYILTMQIDP